MAAAVAKSFILWHDRKGSVYHNTETISENTLGRQGEQDAGRTAQTAA